MSRIFIAAVASLSLTGCSLFLTRGPSKDAVAAAPPDCTNSMTWPAVDGVIAGVLTIAMISAISQDKDNVSTNDPDSDAIASGFIVAGAAGISALVGHSRVSKCRRVNETYMAQAYGQQQQTAYPYGYQQPGYGYPQQQPYPQQYPPQQYPPQQYPPQQYPPQQYPAQQYPAQQYPAQPPTSYPVQQPPPTQPPVAKPTTPPAKPIGPKPPAKLPEPVLGTEGDVCTAQADCSTGFTCTGNVCLKSK